MSLGIYAKGRLLAEEDEFAAYSYAGEDWNAYPSQRGDTNLQDGEIIIRKCCLEEPEIHKRFQRRKNGRKYVVEKRICRLPEVDFHLTAGNVVILQPCRNECHFNYALWLVENILTEWQKTGALPEAMSCFK